MDNAIDVLSANLDNLPEKDREFGGSILNTAKRQLKNQGSMSIKVAHWVAEMAKRATSPEKAATVTAPKMDKLYGLLIGARDRSGGKLKYPKLYLHIGPDLTKVQLVASGKYAGKLKLECTTREGRYGNLWMGVIDQQGTWSLPRGVKQEDQELYSNVGQLLVRLAKDPAKTAKEQAEASKTNTGSVRGHCCFCGLELSDDRSVAVGYGPTCGKNFNLKWGK